MNKKKLAMAVAMVRKFQLGNDIREGLSVPKVTEMGGIPERSTCALCEHRKAVTKRGRGTGSLHDPARVAGVLLPFGFD